MTRVALRKLIDPHRPITYGIVQAGRDYPGGIPYIRPTDMTDSSGVAEPDELLRTSPDIALAYKRAAIAAGDLVVSIGPSYGKVMIVPQELAGANLTQGTARLAPGPDVLAAWLYWALQSASVREFWDAAVGGATFRALNLGPLGETPVTLPSLEEQRQIADFLDDQVTRIDAVLALRRESLRLLELRRPVLFGEAIDETAPEVRLARLLSLGAVGVVVNPSSYFEDEGVPFVHGYNVRDGWLDLSDLKKMSVASSAMLSRSRLRSGDVLVVRAGYPGRAAVVTPELAGGNCASVLLLRTRLDRLVPEYLSAFFNAPQGKSLVDQAQYGAAQGVINLGDVVSFPIPVPSVDEQSRRVLRLSEHLSQNEALVEAARRGVDLLEERKRALITAAVAGEFEVSTAGPRAAAAVTV